MSIKPPGSRWRVAFETTSDHGTTTAGCEVCRMWMLEAQLYDTNCRCAQGDAVVSINSVLLGVSTGTTTPSACPCHTLA